MALFSRGDKGRQAPAEPATVEEAGEGTPGYPRDFSISALRERRLLMALRAVGVGLFAAMALNLVQAFLLVSILPLKETRPFLVRVADEGTVVSSIRPIQDTFEAIDVLTEKLVREYVMNRNEILRSNAIMRERWSGDGYLGVTTASDEYRRFTAVAEENLEAIRNQGAERRVEIQGITPVVTGSVYVVDFRSVSYDERDEVIDDRVYTASIEIDYLPLADLTREQLYLNPTGFTVVNYSLAEKNL